MGAIGTVDGIGTIIRQGVTVTSRERLRPCGRRGQAKPRRPHHRQFAAGVGPRRHWKKEIADMRTLIKNGTVVTAVDQYKGDVAVEDEKIILIGTSLDMMADKVIDASGKYVLPGGI